MKKKHLKLRLCFLYIGSFTVCLAPLIAIVAFNWSDYIETPSDAIKLTVGGMFAVVLLVLGILGKLKLPSKIVWYGVGLIMAYLLQPIIDNILMLFTALLAGELVDMMLFKWSIKRTKEQILINRTADTTTNQVEQVIAKYLDGRV